MSESGTLVAYVTQANSMSPEAIIAIGGLVMSMAQVVKRIVPGDIDEWSPLIVVVLSVIGTGLWFASQPRMPERTDIFPMAVGLAGIMLTALGTYGAGSMTTKTLSLSARKDLAEARERGEDTTPPAIDPVRVPAGDREVVVPVTDPTPKGRARG